jgi:hypothetical protein
MVWICEYPFRTVRLGGPCEDCQGQNSKSKTPRQNTSAIHAHASEDPQVA